MNLSFSYIYKTALHINFLLLSNIFIVVLSTAQKLQSSLEMCVFFFLLSRKQVFDVYCPFFRNTQGFANGTLAMVLYARCAFK